MGCGSSRDYSNSGNTTIDASGAGAGTEELLPSACNITPYICVTPGTLVVPLPPPFNTKGLGLMVWNYFITNQPRYGIEMLPELYENSELFNLLAASYSHYGYNKIEEVATDVIIFLNTYYPNRKIFTDNQATLFFKATADIPSDKNPYILMKATDYPAYMTFLHNKLSIVPEPALSSLTSNITDYITSLTTEEFRNYIKIKGLYSRSKYLPLDFAPF